MRWAVFLIASLSWVPGFSIWVLSLSIILVFWKKFGDAVVDRHVQLVICAHFMCRCLLSG